MLRFGLALCLLGFGLARSAEVRAQDKPRAAASAKRHKASPAPKHRSAKPTAAPPSTDTTSRPAHAEAAPPSAAKPPVESDADEAVRKEGDTEVKTLEFGGLDIEGQLKTPQMLYFLNRLRAEFERPQLPHRSFMPELQRSTKEDAF
jgi:hypothetical protein